MKLLFTLLLAFVLFVVAAAIPARLGFDGVTHPWMPQVLTKFLMLVEVVVLIAIARRPLAEFGFRRGHGPSARLIAAGFGLGALATATILLTGLEGLQRLMKGYTFLQVVLAVWIWSSLVEELFVRGWLQSTLARQGASPRAQILLSAGFFGALHLSLLHAGVEPASVAVIVTATFLLGLICATLRQRTGSLVAPILAHIGFNVGGLAGGIIVTIARKVAAH